MSSGPPPGPLGPQSSGLPMPPAPPSGFPTPPALPSGVAVPPAFASGPVTPLGPPSGFVTPPPLGSFKPPSEGFFPLFDMAGAHSAMIVVWVLCSIAVTVTALRLYSRIRIVRVLSLDDFLIVPAVLFGIALAVMCEITYKGHVDIEKTTAMNFLQVFPFSLSQMFARVSFAISLLEIMGTTRKRRWTVYGMIIVVCIVQLSIVLAPCRRLSDYWTWPRTGDTHCFEAINRIGSRGGQAFISAADAFCDIGLACLPALVLRRLRVRRRVKLGLIVLMGLGVLAGAAALMRMHYLLQLLAARPGRQLEPWAPANWTSAQEYVLLITVSVPGMWPLVRRLRRRGSRATPGASGASGALTPLGPPSFGSADPFNPTKPAHGAAPYTLGFAARAPSPVSGSRWSRWSRRRSSAPPPRPPLQIRWWPRRHPGLPGPAGGRGAPFRPSPAAFRSAAPSARPPITLIGPAYLDRRNCSSGFVAGESSGDGSPASASSQHTYVASTPSGSMSDEYAAHARALGKAAAVAAHPPRPPPRVEVWEREEPGWPRRGGV